MKSWKHKKRKDAVGNPVSCSVNKIFKPRSIKKLKAQNPISCPPTKTFRPENHSKKCNIPTKTSQLKNDGEDGINPFITAQDIPPAINQDNIISMLYLGIYDEEDGLSFDDLFQRQLQVDQTEIYLLYAIKKIDGAVPDLESPLNQALDPTKFILQKYLFRGGKGTYNPIPNQLNIDIYLVEETNPTLEEMQIILQGANTQTFALGNITADIIIWGSFWEYINNSGPYDITDPNKEHYFLFEEDGITYLYYFVGANGDYGTGELQSTLNDYLLVTTSQTVSLIVPSWQQTIDVNRNADRATLYHVAYNGGLFGGYAGAFPTVIIQDPNTDRIYYYGYFTTYQGVTRNHIVAALPDGTIDDTFETGIGFNSFPFQGTRILIQPDGKLVLTGSFTSYNGTLANRIIRLNIDGSVDNTFVYGTGFNNFTLNAVLDNNNKIYVTGIFNQYNGNTGLNRIVRLNPDGSLDGTFVQGTGFNNTVTDLKVDSSNNIYVVGYFASWKGATGNNRIIKILENGDKDLTFDTGTGFNSGNNQPLQVYLTSDNKVFVIGYFTLYNGTTINKMVKLNLDGTIDGSFQSQGTGFNGTNVNQFFEYQGGYLLSGDFTSYNGVASNGTILLDTAGDIVRTFPEFTQVRNILNDGRVIGINWTGSAYNVGILEDNYIVNLKRFNYDETNGKATYEIGGLFSTVEEEILPKRLIRELIQLEAPLPNLSGLVPYTGATQNVDLGNFSLSGNNLITNLTKYNTTYSITGNEPQGAVYWNADRQTLQLKMNGTNYDYGMGLFFYVKNQSGVQINKGDVVGFAGTLGMSGIILGAKYVNDGSQPSDRLMGVAKEDIPNGDEGKVVFFGEIRGIDTSAYLEGDILYSSNVTAGGLINTIPNAGTNKGEIAAVITQSSTVGTIFVRALINKNIDELNNVDIATPTDGQALVYDNGLWKNKLLQREVKVVAGTTYTLLEEDGNKILHFTNNSDVTITIPTGLTPTNRYEGKQLGDGQLIFGTDIGVDLRVGTSEVAKTAEKYSVFGLDVIGTEEYMLFGKLELS